ncbi:ParB N-terminal domain-containing protein [Aquincola tertiaricarbonis]|uniref:ParB N-terminal domain-containing protein n=1 Tax=Aquincola tertiaricarbonis TaxID=391953 RepID=A0ABY4S8U2_AQUTE|nr:plasmid partitioning protein RepB C-terminal domain-containing protein [Aquincola tertiaricarbonis]URI09403.1 ParB N-terminal domain-containing protein [Aquincola tertiaricarbonis]
MTQSSPHIEMIPIADIAVVNPRVRNPRIHKTITESIDQVGLKRPITVRRVPPGQGGTPYALICGQGRLESCRMLGQTEIAALVVDVDEETGHVMSIVENVARRTPRAVETLEHVRVLKQRGYTDSEVAAKLGCTPSWVNNVVNLLERGEKRLLAATEAGHIPINLAVSISRANGADAQQLLMDAYESGELTGRKITVVRKILEQRERSGKKGTNSFARGPTRRQMSPEDLAKLYQRDVEMHRRIQKKAEYTQKSLLLAQQIFKELFASKEFCALLRSEKLVSVPQPLAELMPRGSLAR